jgi:hypothetical protein
LIGKHHFLRCTGRGCFLVGLICDVPDRALLVKGDLPLPYLIKVRDPGLATAGIAGEGRPIKEKCREVCHTPHLVETTAGCAAGGRSVMLFIVHWKIAQENRKAAIQRFLETGGAPPAGATLRGRWHTADGEYGFAIAESDDPQALTKWSLAWNDLLPMEIRPALDDEGLGQVLSAS